MKNHSPRRVPPGILTEVPVKIDVAFRALAYCRSVSDPHSLQHVDPALPAIGRRLTGLEKGVEASALNLVRNYLNGEILLGGEAELEGLAGLDLGLVRDRAEGVDHGGDEVAA